MHGKAGALRTGAVCAALSVATTVLLWLLPHLHAAPAGTEPESALASDPLYLVRLWVSFGHVFPALAGYAAAAWLAARRSPALAWAGLAAFGVWALTEALGVSINLWAVNDAWRPAYADAGAEAQAAICAALLTARGLWDGIFFLVLVAFLAGSLLLGTAASATPGMARAVATLLLLAVPLTLVIMLDGYFGAGLAGWVDWSYPVLQPLSRATMAAWIWREAAAYAGDAARRP